MVRIYIYIEIINDKFLDFSENDGKYWNIYFKYPNITQIIRQSDQYQELCQMLPNIIFVIYWQKARSARADNIEGSQDMSGVQPGGHPGPQGRTVCLESARWGPTMRARTYRAGPDFRGVFAKIQHNQFWPAEHKRGRNIREGEYERPPPCIYRPKNFEVQHCCAHF